MHTAQVRQFSVSMTSSFAEAAAFSEAGILSVVKGLLPRFGGYGLRPVDVAQRTGDGLYDYDLTFSLFNRNGTFRMNAESVHMAFHSARDEKDAGIIADCFLGALECLQERRLREHKLEIYVHATLATLTERDEFLASLGAPHGRLTASGAVFYLPPGPPFGEGRLFLDRSVIFPEAAFLHWTVPFTASPTQSFFAGVPKALGKIVADAGLELVVKQT